MGIEVARGVLSRVRRADDVVIRVEGAADADAVTRALERAQQDVAALGDPSGGVGAPLPPKYVSAVLPSTSGPFMKIGCSRMTGATRRKIPEIIAARLAEEGVKDALITAPRPHEPAVFRLPTLLPKAAVLWLYPAQPRKTGPNELTELADAWLQRAVDWLADGHDGELWAVLEGVRMTVAAADAVEFLIGCRRAQARLVELIVLRDGRFRWLWSSMYAVPTLAIAAGGPATSDEELCERVSSLRDVAVGLLPGAVYANVSIDPMPSPAPWQETPWTYEHRLHPMALPAACGEYVHDAFCWQLLGRGHLARLGTMPPGMRPLHGGKADLWIGDPRDWLLEPWISDEEWWKPTAEIAERRADPEVQRRARTLLAPCLATRQEQLDAVARGSRARA